MTTEQLTRANELDKMIGKNKEIINRLNLVKDSINRSGLRKPSFLAIFHGESVKDFDRIDIVVDEETTMFFLDKEIMKLSEESRKLVDEFEKL